MNLTRIQNAEHEVLSLTDVKTQLRVSGTDDDEYFRLVIPSIRDQVEIYLGRALVTSVWEVTYDEFADEMQIPMAPIQSITSVQYRDTDNVLQTLLSTAYQFDTTGRLKPAYGTDWPSTYERYEAIKITYVAGYNHAGNVPDDIKHAMRLMIGEADLNRENSAFSQVFEIPNSAKNLLAPHRIHRL